MKILFHFQAVWNNHHACIRTLISEQNMPHLLIDESAIEKCHADGVTDKTKEIMMNEIMDRVS